MDLDDIRTFVLVAEAGSIAEAARRLGVPASTVSRRLARLAAAAGAPLGERTARGLRLTRGGEAFLSVARDTVARLDAAREALGGETPPGHRPLRITAPPELCLSLLPDVIAMCRARHPGTRLRIEAKRRAVSLLSEDVDFALRLGPVSVPDAIAKPIGAVRLRVFGRAASGAPVRSPADLSADGFVAVDGLPLPVALRRLPNGRDAARADAPETNPRDDAPLAAHAAGEPVVMEDWTRAGGIETATFSEAAAHVLAGGGFAILPAYTAAAPAVRHGLAQVLPGWIFAREVSLTALYPQRMRGSPEIATLIDLTGAALAGAERMAAAL